MIADKSKTIKNATDQELDVLLNRLRKESELQNIIGSIKRQSSGSNDYYNSLETAVSTEVPIEDLYHQEAEAVLAHFGIPGMKWGKRKGTSVDLHARRQAKLQRKQAKIDAQSDDYKTSRALKAKDPRQLTNKEMKALNERMQLERSLRDLKSSDMQKGLDVVKTITAAGTTIASLYALSTTPLGQAVTKSVKTALTKK